MKKRTMWIVLVAALLGLALWTLARAGGAVQAATAANARVSAEHVAYAAADAPVVTVYKSATCECCAEWAEHLRENGFHVEIVEGEDVAPARARLDVPFRLASCHSATVDGYVLEGHVPADVIGELLRDRPKVAGLAVPGMPEGVPGMPEAGPNRPEYEVIAFQRNGRTQVYATR